MSIFDQNPLNYFFNSPSTPQLAWGSLPIDDQIAFLNIAKTGDFTSQANQALMNKYNIKPDASGTLNLSKHFQGTGQNPQFLGINASTWGQGIQGLNALAGAVNAYSANKQAKEQYANNLALTKQNVANQVKSFNTSLYDRYNNRGQFSGNNDYQMSQYEQNKLTDNFGSR